MKKKRPKQKFPEELKKLFCIMKLAFFFLLLSSNVVWAGQTYAQITSLNLDLSNVSLEEVFDAIRKQSEFEFFYNNDRVDTSVKVTVKAKNADIYAVLEQALPDIYEYKINDRYILVNKRKETAPVLSPQPQQQTKKIITGIITDNVGEPIIGANILEIGTTNGTITDIDGHFSLQVEEKASIRISYIGYLTQEISTTGKTSFKITLIEDMYALEDVIVVGYGTQRKVNLTGSVAAVTVDEKITNRSLTNVSSGLQGLIPGLQVQQTTSMAGKDQATLMIRGLGTVNNAAPLIVVDGMPDVGINRINFADIESISVLKDAASASIYGSRAANGVILITTKTGKGASKTQINFNSSISVEKPTRGYDFMADYPRTLTIHQYRAASGSLKENFIYKDGTIDQWMALGMIDPLRYPNTDWFKTFMRDGSVKRYTVSASGGNDKSNFYLSLGVMDHTGLQIHNEYTRYNTRINLDYDLSDMFTVGARFDGNWSDFTFSGLEEGLTNEGTAMLRNSVPGILPYDPISGRYGGAMAYGEPVQANNPYADFNSKKPKQTDQQANGNMYIDFIPFKGFTVHLDYSLSFTNYFQKTAHIPTGEAYNFQSDSGIGMYQVPDNTPVRDNNTTSYKTQLNGKLNYQKRITQHHNINTLFVYSEEYWHTRSTGAYRNDRLHPTVTEINGALTNTIGNNGNSASEGLRSYIGRLNYDAYDKYLFEFTFRVDGSSKFAKGSQYGFFPSAAVGWRFSEEAFLTPFLDSWMSNGKVRSSYGVTGNNSGVGRFEQLETLTVNNYMSDEEVKGFVNRKMINKDLSWEESRVFNIGLDMSFINNRLTTELDYYNRLTSGMNRPSEMSMLLSGAYSAPRRNIGDLRNRGVEFNLMWRDKIGKMNYSVNLNGAYNRTALEKWNEFLGRGWVFIGLPYHFLYTYENAGIAQTWEDIYSYTPQGLSPGDVIRQDLNGDGIIDGKDRKAYPNIQRDRPTTTFGITLTAAWKGFDLSVLLNGATGRKDYWITYYNETSFANTLFASTWDHWDKIWSLENRDTDWPRFGTNTERSDNSFYLYDFSYLRAKNVQIGYRIPAKFLSSLSISDLRLYVSAENLFTLTKYPGLDPEKRTNERDLYPINRSYSVGINLNL